MARGAASTKKRGDSQGEPQDENQGDFTDIEGAALFPNVERGEDDFIRLLRRDDYDKKMVFHGRLAPHEGTTDKVAELFGGGEYKAIYFTTTEKGSKIAATRTFKLPGSYKPPTTSLPGIGNPPGVTPTPSQPQQPGMKPEVGTVNASEALNSALVGSVIDLLKSLRETQAAPAPRVEWGPIIASLTTVLTTLITTFGSRKQDDSVKQMLEMMERFTEVLKPALSAPQQHSTVKELLEGVQSILDLKEQLDGKGAASAVDPEMKMMEMGAKMIEVMSGAAKTGAATPPRLSPGQPAVPVPDTVPLWQRLLLGQKPALLRSATMGVDPAFTADVAITYMPSEVMGVVKEFVAMPDALSKIMNTIPELQNFPQWTEKFLAAVTESMKDEGEPGEEGGGDAEPE